MRSRVAILAAVLVALVAAPARAETCAAIDGDTLICRGERVRVMGLDTPEMRGACPREKAMARQARTQLNALVAGGVTLMRHGRDRYSRTLAVVRDAGGNDVARLMIAAGLGRPYQGGRRGSWCRP